jgi:predicted nuclease of predicted toxin-antitoxin system
MTLALYMDHQVPRAITTGLRRQGLDILTAFEDGADQLHDPELLNRATELGRPLFSQDEDLLAEAARRQEAGNHSLASSTPTSCTFRLASASATSR